MTTELKKSLLKQFQNQDLKEGFFDATFKIDNKLLYSHRFLLCSVSEPFKVMFSDVWTTQDPIEIKECKFEAFKEFLAYFYHDSCNFNDNHIFEVIILADRYLVGPLLTYLDEYLSKMSFNNDNIFRLFKTLGIHNGFELLKKSLGNYFAAHWMKILESDDFFTAEKDVIIGILEVDREGNETLEEALFEEVFTWAEMQIENHESNYGSENFKNLMKSEMSLFLPKFDFTHMPLDFLNGFVADHSYIFDDWQSVLETAEFSKASFKVDTRAVLKVQILPSNFNGRYDRVSRGTIYAADEKAINELVEGIQSNLVAENGGYLSIGRLHNLKHLESLEYEEKDGDCCLAFRGHGFYLIKHSLYTINQTLYDTYDILCDLTGNHPYFEYEERRFYIQIL